MLHRTYAHWMADDRDVPADALDRMLAGALVPSLRPQDGIEAISGNIMPAQRGNRR